LDYRGVPGGAREHLLLRLELRDIFVRCLLSLLQHRGFFTLVTLESIKDHLTDLQVFLVDLQLRLVRDVLGVIGTLDLWRVIGTLERWRGFVVISEVFGIQCLLS
jgi:hypothetical protein